jgi:SAM-dependent methyltransferase
MSANTNNNSASSNSDRFEQYFYYLKSISTRGRLYKRYISSPILFLCARRFGREIVEIGSGTGSGVLGAFPSSVVGLEINPYAVDYSNSIGLHASLIKEDGVFPVLDRSVDACILDNVLEHIESPRQTMDECWRVTQPRGGLIIAVPGARGFARDADHRIFYEEDDLKHLDPRWRLERLFSIPTVFRSVRLSRALRQYCLVAVYRKKS